ncbi:glycosyltransferase family 2 protein [Methylomonas sp. MK1]|uniref:glycosyltransferase family 2 protein n=1 Tax=Methylomonas sp. MK1 TaxID=1131552 RepID=UPI000373309C|nr:glycosyltransferase family 2 protein [Methylomonas sp. MK1]
MSNNTLNVPVSVVIPAYNVENYILESIYSLTNQSVKPKEIIVINDGSTDNTEKVVLEAFKGDSIVKVFSQENKGLGLARDYGVSLCAGDYIFCCDADDIVLPGLFEEFGNKLIENENMDMFCFSAELFYESGIKEDKLCHHNSDWLENGLAAAFDLIDRGNYTAAVWTYILKRKIIIDNTLQFSKRIHEDHVFTMKAYLLSKVTYRTKEKFYSIRVRAGSLTRSKINIDFVANRLEAFNEALAVLDSVKVCEGYEIGRIRAKYINSALFSLIDMCVSSFNYLPNIVLETIKTYRYNQSNSLKEMLLLRSPALYFVIKKIFFTIKSNIDKGRFFAKRVIFFS